MQQSLTTSHPYPCMKHFGTDRLMLQGDPHVFVPVVPIFRLCRSSTVHQSMEAPPLVDDVWQRIIRKFVPDDRIQFYPTIIYAGRRHSEKYYWIIPFDRVRCIDIERSDIKSMIKRPEITLIYSCDFYVHFPSCLGESHIARDEQQTGHLIVSDQLRDALAETGEASMFYRPEDVPQLSERKIH
jgi:hypothetical protein